MIPSTARPQAVDHEAAVISACFINPEIVPKVKSLVSRDDFYRIANQYIFEAICEAPEIDLLAVKDWLTQHDKLKQAGPPGYLAEVAFCGSTSAGYEYHCKMIQASSTRRKIINTCSRTADQAYDDTLDVDEILSDHTSGIRDIMGDSRPDYTPASQIINTVFEQIEDRKRTGNRYVGVLTGFKNLDDRMGGMEPGTSIYFIARPGVGKTAYAINIAENVAAQHQGSVLYFAHEAGEIPLTRRRLSIKSGVYLSRLRSGDVDDSQWPDLIQAANDLADTPLIILDRPKYIYIEELVNVCESFSLQKSISLIVIDHIQLMYSKKRNQNRHLEISHISGELQRLAKSLKCPILILSQLNRENEKMKDKRPKLHEIKESGDVEQNADVVIGLYREDRKISATEIIILKGRDIDTGTEYLRFERYFQKFYDSDRAEYDHITGRVDKMSWVEK